MGVGWGPIAGRGVTGTCAPHTRRAQGSAGQQERALLRAAHPPIFSVFFFAFWLCQQTVTKSWQNRAEPLAPGELSPGKRSSVWLSAGCGCEISLRAGDGAASAVSLIQGFLQAAEFPGVSVFSRRSVEDFEITLLGVAGAVYRHERRWSCQEVVKKELGRLQRARLASAVLSFLSSPGLSPQGLLSAMAQGELKIPLGAVSALQHLSTS